MDILTAPVKKLYGRFLAASMCSALVMSIYSFVDIIAVGRSEGTSGAAAMAVITPLYGILVYLAILSGIDGSVLLGNAKGEGNEEKGNINGVWLAMPVSEIAVAVIALYFVFLCWH